MRLVIHDTLSSIALSSWNSLNAMDNPFLRYEFLAALENTGCVGEKVGWLPRYITAYDNETLIGAVPAYIKYNSEGEFIFDWAWAHAYQQHGLNYYPKLLIGIPFTPVMGQRLLVHPDIGDKNALQIALINHAKEYAQTIDASSVHCLFTTPPENQLLIQQGFMPRIGHQFHWHNNHYETFEHFLDSLTSRHRKKINRERQRMTEQGITLNVIAAKDVDENLWRRFYEFYSATYYYKNSIPYLNFEFFEEIAKAMPEAISIVTAQRDNEIVATALFFHNADTWYGRYWGCSTNFHSLHFETCYYTPIEHCIKNSIPTFEAGAQGEHKLSRGLLPTAIHSTHWIEDSRFRAAIDRYLQQETQHMLSYHDTLNEHSPFKKALNLTPESN